jgi:hypothetical protein
MEAIEEGGARGTQPMAGGRAGKRGGGAELKVEDAPDRWAPPIGDHVREREGSGALVGLLGQKRGAGPRRGEEGRWPAGWVWG